MPEAKPRAAFLSEGNKTDVTDLFHFTSQQWQTLLVNCLKAHVYVECVIQAYVRTIHVRMSVHDVVSLTETSLCKNGT